MQQQLVELLTLYIPTDDTEATHKQRALDFVTSTAVCTNRETLTGHVTASAWILSPDRLSTLLTHHKKLGRWLQLGGHIENDRSIQDAAIREASEESGISNIRLLDRRLFDIDVHLIPAGKSGPEHYHYDFRFAVESLTKTFSVSDESHNLAWVELSAITSKVADASIIRMAKKTAAFLNHIGE